MIREEKKIRCEINICPNHISVKIKKYFNRKHYFACHLSLVQTKEEEKKKESIFMNVSDVFVLYCIVHPEKSDLFVCLFVCLCL
jgi:hypothetical protein